MDIFTRWNWIKRNWQYVLGEAQHLGLVFVGGTAINLVIFDEYRASEDIDLYNPDSKGPDNPNGKSEEELAKILSELLAKKDLKSRTQKAGCFISGQTYESRSSMMLLRSGKLMRLKWTEQNSMSLMQTLMQK